MRPGACQVTTERLQVIVGEHQGVARTPPECGGCQFALERLMILLYIRCMDDVCLFAHFDKDDKVDEYVFRYLDKIKELNFAIVFISTARLATADVERLHSVCFDVILRQNAGLDFGSWSAG